MAGDQYAQPPRRENAAGGPRRVGVEIEFAGVPLRTVARLIVDLYGGEAEQRDKFRWEVAGSELGNFSLTVDASLLRDHKYAEVLDGLGLGGIPALERLVGDAVALLVSPVVPFEVVTDPLPLADLPRLEELREALLAEQARGTGASWLLGFGLHLNPEAPDLEVATLRDHLRAFLLLAEWLGRDARTDLTRRVLPYIDPFPEEYRRRIVSPDYEPDQTAFIEDYLAASPTRNRPLDLLPILAELDAERVRAAVEQPDLVRGRPAFHYRLPDCRVDEPDWTIAQEWNRWVVVERLANRPARLRAASEALLAESGALFGGAGGAWADRVTEWIEPVADEPVGGDGG